MRGSYIIVQKVILWQFNFFGQKSYCVKIGQNRAVAIIVAFHFFGAAGEKNLGENQKIQEELRTKKFCAKRSLRDLFKNTIVLGGPPYPQG